MQCSGCGAEISAVGDVCPFCGRDKSDDVGAAWGRFIGAALGAVIGYVKFGSLVGFAVCAVVGYVAGFIFGIVASGKKNKKPANAPMPQAPAPGIAQPPAGNSAADKLAQLKQMHDQGLLTDAEYASKKAEILAEL